MVTTAAPVSSQLVSMPSTSLGRALAAAAASAKEEEAAAVRRATIGSMHTTLGASQWHECQTHLEPFNRPQCILYHESNAMMRYHHMRCFKVSMAAEIPTGLVPPV